MAAVSTRLNTLRRITLSALLFTVIVIVRMDRPSAGRANAAAQTSSPTPQHIVSVVPAATEMIFAMGAGGRLAGVGSYDRFPPEVERLPRVGGLLDPNVEKILSLRPDLVIVYDTQKELQQQLARANIPMFSYRHRDLSDISTTVRAIGKLIGAKQPAEATASRIEREMAAIRARVARRPRPRTLLVFGREPGAIRRVEASGGYGFLHDMLEMAGGADVLADIRRESVQMSTEMILARAPEVIVELRYGDLPNPEQLELQQQVWNALSSVPAVKNHKVYLMVGEEFVVPGPRIPAAAERLARALHPEAFR